MSDCGVQSNQAISNYYSELNHLTQELQGSSSDLNTTRKNGSHDDDGADGTSLTNNGLGNHQTETYGEEDETSPFYNRTDEKVQQIAQYVSDIHSKTVMRSHEYNNGRQSDGSADELDGDRLNDVATGFNGLSLLHSVNLKSE